MEALFFLRILSIVTIVRSRVFFFELIEVGFVRAEPVEVSDVGEALGGPDEHAPDAADGDHDF